MPSNDVETSVVVIGGGPVGLAMALELGLQGVQCLVVEEEPPEERVRAKAGSVSFRSVEHCRRWGVLDALYNCGFPGDYPLDMVFCTNLAGREIARQPGASMADFTVPPTTPVRRQRCPQMWFDRILRRGALSFDSVDMLEGHRVVDLAQTEDGVTARATDCGNGETRTVRSRYAVLCEGSGGELRRQVGIRTVGDPLLNYSVSIVIRCPELLEHARLGPAVRYVFIDQDGTWGNWTVIDGTEYWRLTVILDQQRIDFQEFDPHAWLRKALGDESVPYELLSVEPWRRSATVATDYRRDRVFLAGDAAHTMSNTGGFGMNTGLGDVVNLGWKLRAGLEGWGSTFLLDSYSSERRAMAWRNIGFSNEILSAWLPTEDCSRIDEESPSGDEARARIASIVLGGTRSEWGTAGAALGYTYESSPVCVPDGTTAPRDAFDDYVPSARPGARAPHSWLADGKSTLDLFDRSFTLMCFGAPEGTEHLTKAAAARGVPMQAVRIEDPDTAALYGRGLVLVRPDGHVCWRGDSVDSSADGEAIVDVVRGHPFTNAVESSRTPMSF